MYIIGGVNAKGENNPFMYQLDMNSFKWTKKETTGTYPGGRDDFGMSLEGDNLYVFGGFVSGRRHNDLHVYSFTSNKWECLFAKHPYHELEESKDFPLPRSGLAIGAFGQSVIIFGG
jgi:N-acetylneuraminic acid mutarotase